MEKFSDNSEGQSQCFNLSEGQFFSECNGVQMFFSELFDKDMYDLLHIIFEDGFIVDEMVDEFEDCFIDCGKYVDFL